MRLTAEDMRPVVKIDAVLDLADINEDLWNALAASIACHSGMDNARRSVCVRGAQLLAGLSSALEGEAI